MKNLIKQLIETEIDEIFSGSPKMGCILDKCEDMERPKNGMDISQHKKMMWINENANKALPGAIKEFIKYAKKKLMFDKSVKIILRKDKDNSINLLGKTGEYNPNTMEVIIYISGRHPKDILRSISHELVHHAQNCRGEFDRDDITYEEGYAQKDSHMRSMEEEAFKDGNMIFRDWCDKIKSENNNNII